MFIGRRADGTVYGAWTCAQPVDADHPPLEEVADDHPDLVAFLAPKPVPDRSSIDNAEKLLRAICIYFGQQAGKTPAQVKAGVRTAYDALP